MLMTACDVAAIAKPWPVQQRVSPGQLRTDLIYSECTFFLNACDVAAIAKPWPVQQRVSPGQLRTDLIRNEYAFFQLISIDFWYLRQRSGIFA